MQHASLPEVLRNRLDAFDAVGAVAVAIFLLSAIYFGLYGTGSTRPPKAAVAQAVQAATDPKMTARITAARMQMEAGQLKESVEELKKLTTEYPVLAEPHSVLGQAYSRLQDNPDALREFRLALQIDPDYIDSKSPKFIGKRIKSAVRESITESQTTLQKNPNDQAAKSTLSDARYLERMLAGGCE